MQIIPTLLQTINAEHLAANAFIGLNLLMALLLGALVGYERSYQGRAAGMRTYGLVCMASTALTVFVGFAPLWYGGAQPSVPLDPTRVVQGVVSGIGFLCAGVIMKDGMRIRGLSTAASIWAVAAVGVLIGVNFYLAAAALALLSAFSMSMLRRLEHRLPGRSTLDVQLSFRPGYMPNLEDLRKAALAHGHEILRDSLVINVDAGRSVWRFAVVSIERARAASPTTVAEELCSVEGIDSFSITPVRH